VKHHFPDINPQNEIGEQNQEGQQKRAPGKTEIEAFDLEPVSIENADQKK
jgi:hypothetical protein